MLSLLGIGTLSAACSSSGKHVSTTTCGYVYKATFGGRTIGLGACSTALIPQDAPHISLRLGASLRLTAIVDQQKHPIAPLPSPIGTPLREVQRTSDVEDYQAVDQGATTFIAHTAFCSPPTGPDNSCPVLLVTVVR